MPPPITPPSKGCSRCSWANGCWAGGSDGQQQTSTLRVPLGGRAMGPWALVLPHPVQAQAPLSSQNSNPPNRITTCAYRPATPTPRPQASPPPPGTGEPAPTQGTRTSLLFTARPIPQLLPGHGAKRATQPSCRSPCRPPPAPPPSAPAQLGPTSLRPGVLALPLHEGTRSNTQPRSGWPPEGPISHAISSLPLGSRQVSPQILGLQLLCAGATLQLKLCKYFLGANYYCRCFLYVHSLHPCNSSTR